MFELDVSLRPDSSELHDLFNEIIARKKNDNRNLTRFVTMRLQSNGDVSKQNTIKFKDRSLGIIDHIGKFKYVINDPKDEFEARKILIKLEKSDNEDEMIEQIEKLRSLDNFYIPRYYDYSIENDAFFILKEYLQV